MVTVGSTPHDGSSSTRVWVRIRVPGATNESAWPGAGSAGLRNGCEQCSHPLGEGVVVLTAALTCSRWHHGAGRLELGLVGWGAGQNNGLTLNSI